MLNFIKYFHSLFFFTILFIESLYIVNGSRFSKLKTNLINIVFTLVLDISVYFIIGVNTMDQSVFYVLYIIIPISVLYLIIGEKKYINAICGIASVFLVFYSVLLLKDVLVEKYDSILTGIILFLIIFPSIPIYFNFFYKQLQDGIERHVPKYIYLLLLYTIAILSEIIIYRAMIQSTTSHVLRIEIFGVAIISVYIISIIGFHLVFKALNRNTIQLEQERMHNNILEVVKNDYELKCANDEKIKVLRHDMKHLLINVTSLINNECYQEAVEFINDYIDDINKTAEINYCTDRVINSILNYYYEECIKNKIHIDMNVRNIDEKLTISSFEIALLLSNLFSNAINASLKLNEMDRDISFSFINNEDRLILRMKNNYNGEIKTKNGQPFNDEQNHGFGSKSTIWFTNRNNLVLDYSISDNVFIVSILF